MEIITQQTLEDFKNYDSQKATLQYYLDYLGLHDIHEEGVQNADVKQTLKEMRTLGYACSEGQLRYTSQIMNNKMFQPLYVTDTSHQNQARYIVGITDDQAVVMHSQRYDSNDKYTYIIYPPKYGDTLLDALSEAVMKQIARNSNIDKEDIDKINQVIVSDMENAILGVDTVGGKPNIGDIQKGGELKRTLYYDNGVVKQKLTGDIESGNKRVTFEITGEERQQQYELKITEQTKHKWLLGLETSNTDTVKLRHLEQAIKTIGDEVRDRLSLEVTQLKHTVEDSSVTISETEQRPYIIQQNTAIDPYTYDVKQGTRRVYEELLDLREYNQTSSNGSFKTLAASGGAGFDPLYTVQYQYYDQDIKGIIGKEGNKYRLIEEDTPVTDIKYRLKYNVDTELNYLLSRINGCDEEYVTQGYAEGLRNQRERIMESPGEMVTPNVAIGGQTKGITLHQSFERHIHPTYIVQHLTGQYSDGKKTMVVFADQQENNNYNAIIAVQDNKKQSQIEDENERQVKLGLIDHVNKDFAYHVSVRYDVEAIEYYEDVSTNELITRVAEAQKILYGIEIPKSDLDVDDIDWSFADEPDVQR